MITPDPVGESLDLGELRRLLAEATAGPWSVSPDDSCTDWSCDHPLIVRTIMDTFDGDEEEITQQIAGLSERSSQDPNAPRHAKASANAALIVALVNAAPALLSSAERASRLEAALREMGFEFSRRSVNLANEGARLAYHEAEKMIHKALAATPEPK